MCVRDIYFDENATPTPVYHLSKLCHGQTISGPALLLDPNATVLVEPDCSASLTAVGDLEVVLGDGVAKCVIVFG